MGLVLLVLVASHALAQPAPRTIELPPTPPVEVEYDRTAPFARYRVFNWAPDLEALKNATNHKLLVAAVERTLAARGMTKAPAGAPADVFVSFYARPVGKLKPQTTEKTAPNRDPAKQGVVTTIERERVGALAIEFIDGISRQMVWRAMGTQMLGTQTESAEQIERYVTSLLEKYPPSPSTP